QADTAARWARRPAIQAPVFRWNRGRRVHTVRVDRAPLAAGAASPQAHVPLPRHPGAPGRLQVADRPGVEAEAPPRRPPALERSTPYRLPWAELLRRVVLVDALECPRCHGRMRVVAAITDPVA